MRPLLRTLGVVLAAGQAGLAVTAEEDAFDRVVVYLWLSAVFFALVALLAGRLATRSPSRPWKVAQWGAVFGTLLIGVLGQSTFGVIVYGLPLQSTRFGHVSKRICREALTC